VAISPDGGKVFSAGESWYDYTKIISLAVPAIVSVPAIYKPVVQVVATGIPIKMVY